MHRRNARRARDWVRINQHPQIGLMYESDLPLLSSLFLFPRKSSSWVPKVDSWNGALTRHKIDTASIPENGSYAKDQTIGSFVGFVPADHPQFIMLVITRKPKVLFEGAYVAAPIWKQVASALITQWQIAP